MKSRVALVSMTITWILTVGLGLGVLMNYENSPGVAATPNKLIASGNLSENSSSRPTLILFAHPKCPCTRASIEELSKIMKECQGRLAAKVFFFKPSGVESGWEKTDLWDSAAAIPGVQVFKDEKGAQARRFHVKTSGQTLLYNQNGQLLFSGGITESRGHIGDNAGKDAIVSFVETGRAERKSTFVFGCSLVDPEFA